MSIIATFDQGPSCARVTVCGRCEKNAADRLREICALRSIRHPSACRIRVAAKPVFPRGLAILFRVRCDWLVSGSPGSPESSAPSFVSEPGLEVFPSYRSRVDGLVSARAPLRKLRRPSGPCTDEASRHQSANSSRGLPFRSTHAATEVRFTRARPAPGTFRPQGLITLSTACSLDRLADLVSDRQRPSDSPFGALIPAESCHASSACRAPHAVCYLMSAANRRLAIATIGNPASGFAFSESRTAPPSV